VFLILNSYCNAAVWICKNKSLVSGNIKREITVNLNFNWMFQWQILCTEPTNLLKFTRNVPNSHRQPQCTLRLFSEDRVSFVWVDLRASLRGQRHMQFVSCIQFFLIRSSFNPTNISNVYEEGRGWGGGRTVRASFSKLYLGNHSEVDTCSDEPFFSQWPIYLLPKYWLLLRNHPV